MMPATSPQLNTLLVFLKSVNFYDIFLEIFQLFTQKAVKSGQKWTKVDKSGYSVPALSF